MKLAFVVRDELQPVRHGYHNSGVNLLRQLALTNTVRCIYLGSQNATGPMAEWCADHGITYVPVEIPELTSMDAVSAADMISKLIKARKPSVQESIRKALHSVQLGEDDEAIVLFNTGWDAFTDVVGSYAKNVVCIPSDSITLFEKRRVLHGAKRLLGVARVQLAAWRERAMLRAGFTRFLYVTEIDAALARTLAPELTNQIGVMPIGINPDEFEVYRSMSERLAQFGELLVFTGSLGYLPNSDAAERLATQILPKLSRKSVHLRLVGNGGEALRHLAGPRVEVEGWAPSLIAEMQNATLFVAPVRMGGGAKNNVLQALAAGTPVIGTAYSFAGFKTLPPGGVLCDSDDDFVHAIEALLADRDRLFALSDAARKYALSRIHVARICQSFA